MEATSAIYIKNRMTFDLAHMKLKYKELGIDFMKLSKNFNPEEDVT